MRRSGVIIGLLWSMACSLSFFAETSWGLESSQNGVSYNEDIRPVLAKHCFSCHGPDQAARQGDLRLDGFGGHSLRTEILNPGKPGQSELIARVSSDDEALRMPPEPKMALTSGEIALLERWIQEGARRESHWSLIPPRRPSVPSVGSNWAINPIDRFIFSRLATAGIRPSPEAARETLIRRASLDLIGLPPSPAEVETFLKDHGPGAYSRLVDRLMERVEFAERRAQDWLDLSRYADSRGFADDQTREIWPWRDWVIHAIDENMPFDQFTVEQLAGDMLPDPSLAQRIATGFNRNAPQAKGMTYPVEEFRLKGVIDRVNTIGRVWMGLTLDCAECHDHKFDPITQADYYSMVAIFNNIEHTGTGFKQGGPTVEYPMHGKETGFNRGRDLNRVREALIAAEKTLPPPGEIQETEWLGQWEGPAVEQNPNHFSLRKNLTITARIRTTQPVADLVSKYDWMGGQRSYVFGIGGENDPGSKPGHLFFWASSTVDPFRGVTVNGSFPVNDGRDHHVAVEFVAGESVRLFVDGIEDRKVRIEGGVPKTLAVSNRPLAVGSGYNNSGDAAAYRYEGKLSKVQLSDRPLGNRLSVGSAGDTVAMLRNEWSRLLSDSSDGDDSVLVPVMRERDQVRETFIHVRGDFLNRGPRVAPRAPALLERAEGPQRMDRLAFARWLMSDQHPLVARVVVNRYWQSYFGHGLVRTPDDFGVQGDSPTHPQLLDWLAREFVESGWDRKHIHRLIVTSATYRQSSVVPNRATELDPENRLLSYMPRLRLPAEQLRDQALAVSGLLIQQVGGPPVFPIQPDGYWQQRALPGDWKNSEGQSRHRRSIYTYWRRMALHPTLEILGAPARELCVVKREYSNLPTQALVLMNDPIFHEAAGAFANRLVEDFKLTDAERIVLAFQVALGREPTETERKGFESFVIRQRAIMTGHRLENSGPNTEETPSRSTNVESKGEVALWTLVSGVLLNLDEMVNRP